ncbi:EAL domain-containing protein [Niveibacterium sp. SC-1]|uniref:EAL domain-containing protein n=1 Tax=Niveibacterium sp. SC-1 TaxID=3135646 RepID=UPI00311D93A5
MSESRLPLSTEVVAVLTAVLAFCVALLTFGSLNVLFARRGLDDQAQQMLYQLEDAAIQAHEVLLTLPGYESLGCESGVSKLLARQVFKNGYVRWVAVLRDAEVVCRSDAAHVLMEGERTLRALRDGWWFGSVRHPDGTLDLFLVRQVGAYRYVANVEPLLYDFLSHYACAGCTAYEASVGGTPVFVFGSRPLRTQPVLSVARSRKLGAADVTLHLSADARYLAYYRELGWVTSTLFAFALAALCGGLLYRALKVRASLDFLIRDALRRQEFIPYYQPIVDPRSGAVLGAEVLARWRQRSGTLVPPGEFIPYAEANGWVDAISERLIARAARDLVSFGWRDSGRWLSLNFTPAQAANPAMREALLATCRKHALAPDHFALEITERQPFENLDQARRALESLVAQGVEIELDDAGTGFGGFAAVQELPIGTMKIDKMFVDALRVPDDSKRVTLDAIIDFARTVGLKTIAEGVETRAQVDYLVGRGITAIQGYYYARPMSGEDFVAWLAQR